MRLTVYRSIGLDDMHPRVLKELVDVVSKALYLIFKKLCLSN